MRVTTKKTEEEIRKEFFGPLKEASKTEFSVGIDPRSCWCELSELRLMMLLIQFKPAGVNRHFHLGAIVDHMWNIYDNEITHADIFLDDKNKVRFRNQQRELISSIPSEVSKRMTFPPKYQCRPTLEQVQEKISQFYDMKIVEKNEGHPDKFETDTEFVLPPGITKKDKGERGASVASTSSAPASKRRRVASPEE